jgi:carbon-monoxide dehydrogenase large subunit
VTIGVSVPRKEDPELLTGQARFVDDLTLPGMVWMTVVRSPYAHARITGVDVSKALAAPGVLGAFRDRISRTTSPPACPARGGDRGDDR